MRALLWSAIVTGVSVGTPWGCGHVPRGVACAPCIPLDGTHEATGRIGLIQEGWCEGFSSVQSASDGFDSTEDCWEIPRQCSVFYTFEQRQNAALDAAAFLDEHDFYSPSHPEHNVVVTEEIRFLADECGDRGEAIEVTSTRVMTALAFRMTEWPDPEDRRFGDDSYVSEEGVEWLVPKEGRGGWIIVGGERGPMFSPGL